LKSQKVDPKDGENMFLLGETYTRTNELDSAMYFYTQAETLLSKSRAKELQIPLLKAGIEYTQEMMQIEGPNLRVPVNAMSINVNAINTPYNEYGYNLTPDGKKVYFTSRRNNTTGGGVGPSDQEYFEDIYCASWNAATKSWDSITNKLERVNGIGFDAITHISADGLFMYFTVNTDGMNLKKSTGSSDIYSAELSKKGKWSVPRPLKGKGLNTSYSESGATLTADGSTMYFVSDRKGDRSGTDIYVTKMVGKTWSTPVLVSDSINTKGRETTPYITADGRFLFFSSDGHKGMGGYDIFVSENNGKTWSKPKNLGSSVNSTNDDTHFKYDPKTKQGSLAGIELLEGKGTIDIFLIDLSTKEIIKQ
jgi:WD40-like Beta Propeller Repeat